MPSERFVYNLKDGDGSNRLLLGGKGANLCTMAQSGLPVPPGFILTTEVCRKYMQNPAIMDEVWDDVKASVAQLEKETGKGFNDQKNPLFSSSGCFHLLECRASQKGMKPNSFHARSMS